ncbi:MAG: MBL fold metallo-hydrolase [Treponema sp.]|jgi:phosphoribosyl 1,2-cyclic phosphodiesterase|nr:MBL fold metallo-hydrolase [Treponema sp.]
MRIQFWGVRGSLPSPQLPSQIKSKISAIIERLTPGDLESPETRERFLADLPPWLFGTVGGNSPCVAVRLDNNREIIVFDAGSGIREFGLAASREKPKPSGYHIFFSHFHWDHIMGLPFFNPAYDPSVRLDFYSPFTGLEMALHGQMTSPYFPVHVESMGSKKKYHHLKGSIKLLGSLISCRKLNHPGDSFSYKVEHGKRKIIYATDTELSADDFIKNDENTSFFSDADLIIMDAQYTLGEAIEKYNWGHSAFSLAIDFVANWNIRHIVLFHHDPTYDDHKLYNILQSAKWYMERMNVRETKLSLAMEGMEIVL